MYAMLLIFSHIFSACKTQNQLHTIQKENEVNGILSATYYHRKNKQNKKRKKLTFNIFSVSQSKEYKNR